MLQLCEWVLEFYATYILIRCAKFTNSRSRAERIGVYTLITTCLLAREIEHLGQLGLLIDTMADVVAEDMLGTTIETPDRHTRVDDLLIPDGKLRGLADELNRLERFTRAVLVFHHVEGLDTEIVAGLLQSSPMEVTARIAGGERLLRQRLGESHAWGHRTDGRDVQALLAELAESIDAHWIREVGDCARDYLARRGQENT